MKSFSGTHASVSSDFLLICSSEASRSEREQAEIREFSDFISAMEEVSLRIAALPRGSKKKTANGQPEHTPDMESLLQVLQSEVGAGYNPDTEELPPVIFHFWADAAFLNLQVNGEILKLHETYLSEYVFAEGFPGGVSGVLVSAEIFPKLLHDAGGAALTRDGFFNVILKDFNAYDIETVVSPSDLRMLRLELYRDRSLNSMVCDSLSSSIDSGTPADMLCSIIEKNRASYRSLPAHILIEILESPKHIPSYLPPGPKNTGELSNGNFSRILDAILDVVEDPVITIGPRHEPSVHSDFPAILRTMAAYAGAVTFVIETSGIGWTPQALQALQEIPPHSLNLIVCLDAVDPQLYTSLRGGGYEEAMGFIDHASRELSCGFFVQAVRMKENEEHLMTFYNHWKEKHIQVIIQKYTDFSQTMPDRKVTDLSPLNRHECWHLKRELYIRLDGSVFACLNHAIIPGEETFNFGNVYTDNMNSIWEAGRHLYLRHLEHDLPEVCRKCDEWYTFNF